MEMVFILLVMHHILLDMPVNNYRGLDQKCTWPKYLSANTQRVQKG